MNQTLKKFGITNLKHEIPFLTPKSAKDSKNKQSSQKQSNKNEKSNQPRLIKQFNPTIFESPNSKRPASLLSCMVELLKRKQQQTCPLPDHENNSIKYICLQQNCQTRTGCSYCFLHNHKLHKKMEIKTCLTDLDQLSKKTMRTRGFIKQKLMKSKQDLLNQLKKEIQQIRKEFQTCLQYLEEKSVERINALFQGKCDKYMQFEANLNTSAKSSEKTAHFPQNIRKQSQIIQKESENVNSFSPTSYQYAIQKFKEDPTQTPKRVQKLQIITSQKQPIKQKTFKQVSNLRFISKKEQESILVKLSRLNVSYVETFLQSETESIEEFMNSLQPFSSYFAEMSSSLSQFFSAFKRSIPEPKAYSIDMLEPQILKLCEFSDG